MIVLIAKNIVREEHKEAFLGVAKVLVEETRKEMGCVYYDFVADETEKDTYYFVEKYKNQEAVAAHRASAHFCTYVPQMQELRADSTLITGQVMEFEEN